MLQVTYIRNHKEQVLERLAVRNFEAAAIIDQVLELDDQRKHTQQKLDDTLAHSNRLAKEIGALFKEGKADEAQQLKKETGSLKEQSKALQQELHDLEQQLRDQLVHIPNTPCHMVPAGKSAEDNEVVSQEGDIPELGDAARPHWELAEQYDLIDFSLGVKVTGAGFPVYKNKGARLQRALINFFLDRNIAAGYTEYQPPHVVNEASGFGTGQLPDKEGQMYHIGMDDLYLIPTAEVPVTNFFRDTILKENDFPVKCTAYTPCFRREAGSYGKDVRGLNRLHQFDKVEVVQIQHPDRSYETLDEMVEHVAGLLRELELPFRILRLCGGDMGFTSALTYDFEVYSTAQQRWLEVSSVSNFESYQANRLKLRYKDKDNKTHLCHTLNGSSLALPRIVAALLENHQGPEGIRIPEVLQTYTGFDHIS